MDANDDGLNPHRRIVHVTSEASDALIQEALRSTFSTGGCLHKHDCCGCVSGYVSRAHKLLSEAWLSTEHDTWINRRNAPGHSVFNGKTAEVYDELLARMGGEVNKLRRGLERQLLAMERRDWDTAKEAGRLDTRRFPALLAGRAHVFKTRTDRVEVDTAVTFLVDLSGSMNGTRAACARDCLVAFCASLDRTGVAYEVLGHGCPHYMPDVKPVHVGGGDAAQAKEFAVYARLTGLRMVEFKAFSDRLFEARGAIGWMGNAVAGENADGEAIMLAWGRLRERREGRKVLFVLSDGAPACNTYQPYSVRAASQAGHLRRAVAMVEAEGGECGGLGIQTDSVSQFYPKHVVVQSVGDLGRGSAGRGADRGQAESGGVPRDGRLVRA